MPASSPQPIFGLIVENIGGGELVVIVFLALVVLGPERIPEMARGAGRLINKVKTMSSDLTGEMSDVINDPSMQPIRELGEFATRPRQKLAEYALEAEAEERQRKAELDRGEDGPDTDGAVLDAPAEPDAPEDTHVPEDTQVPADTGMPEDTGVPENTDHPGGMASDLSGAIGDPAVGERTE